MKRAAIILMSILLLTTVLPGCLQGNNGGGGNAKPVIYGTTDSVDNMDPAIPFSYFDDSVLFPNVFQTLLTYKPGTTDITGLLAKSYSVSNDGKTYTFQLVHDATFSNGDKMTSKDVVFSFQRVMQGQVGNKSVNGAFLADDIKSVQAQGDYSVVIQLGNASSAFPFALTVQTFSIVDSNVYKMNVVRDGFSPDKLPVGTGPYMVQSFKQGDSITLKPNPHYAGSAPKNSGVLIKFYSDSSALKSAVESGDVDVAFRTFKPSQYNDLKSRAGSNPWQTKSVTAPVIRYIVFQQNVQPFDNVHVRRAIAAAVDRQQLVNAVFLGTATPLYSTVPAGLSGHQDSFKSRYGAGPNDQMALQELAQAGYTPANPLKITLWYTPSHYGDTEAQVAQLLKSQLENTSAIKVTLQSKEWSSYIDGLVKGQLGIYLLGWFPDYVDADDYLYPFLQTPGSHGATGARIQDNATEFNQLLNQERNQSIGNRAPTFTKLQNLEARSVPYVPMWQENQNFAMGDNVQGFNIGPSQIVYFAPVSVGSSSS